MNIKFSKDGSKIHIKKSHEGSFTEHCGGKVTDACILAAKHSSNPKLRKKAVFAENARKWKHLYGGSINGAPYKKLMNLKGHIIPDKKREETIKMNLRRYPGITEKQALGIDSIKIDHHYYRINKDGDLIPSRRYALGGKVFLYDGGGNIDVKLITDTYARLLILNLLNLGNEEAANLIYQKALSLQQSSALTSSREKLFALDLQNTKSNSGGFLNTINNVVGTGLSIMQTVNLAKNTSTTEQTLPTEQTTVGATAEVEGLGTKPEGGTPLDTTPKTGTEEVKTDLPVEDPNKKTGDPTEKKENVAPILQQLPLLSDLKFNLGSVVGNVFAQLTGNEGWNNLGNMNFWGGESNKHKRETLFNDNQDVIKGWGLAEGKQTKLILNSLNNGESYTDSSGKTWKKGTDGKLISIKSGGKVFGLPYCDPTDDTGKVNPVTHKLIKRKGNKYNIGGKK